MAKYVNIGGEPPPGYDFGHAIMPSQVRKNGGKIYGLLNAVGSNLEDINRSRVAGTRNGRPEIIDTRGFYDAMGTAAVRMQDRLNHLNSYDQHMYDNMGQYTFDRNGNMYLDNKLVQDIQVTQPVNDIYNYDSATGFEEYQAHAPVYNNPYSQQQNISYNNMADINQYLQGAPAPVQRPVVPTPTTTITFVDLQNANKPIVDKLEVVCQLLGKVWGAEMQTQQTLSSLPEQIALEIVERLNVADDSDDLNTDEVDVVASTAVQDAESYLNHPVVEVTDEVKPVAPRKPRKVKK